MRKRLEDAHQGKDIIYFFYFLSFCSESRPAVDRPRLVGGLGRISEAPGPGFCTRRKGSGKKGFFLAVQSLSDQTLLSSLDAPRAALP